MEDRRRVDMLDDLRRTATPQCFTAIHSRRSSSGSTPSLATGSVQDRPRTDGSLSELAGILTLFPRLRDTHCISPLGYDLWVVLTFSGQYVIPLI